jgi:hypothetical protein
MFISIDEIWQSLQHSLGLIFVDQGRSPGRIMLTKTDIFRVAHLMLHEYGGEAEDTAAKYADIMRGCGDWDALLTWTSIRQTIALIHRAPTTLPN